MEDEQKEELETTLETMQDKEHTEEKPEKKASGDSVFAGIYDQLPDISVKALDRFILVCVIAFVVVILLGVLKANHIF